MFKFTQQLILSYSFLYHHVHHPRDGVTHMDWSLLHKSSIKTIYRLNLRSIWSGKSLNWNSLRWLWAMPSWQLKLTKKKACLVITIFLCSPFLPYYKVFPDSDFSVSINSYLKYALSVSPSPWQPIQNLTFFFVLAPSSEFIFMPL